MGRGEAGLGRGRRVGSSGRGRMGRCRRGEGGASLLHGEGAGDLAVEEFLVEVGDLGLPRPSVERIGDRSRASDAKELKGRDGEAEAASAERTNKLGNVGARE